MGYLYLLPTRVSNILKMICQREEPTRPEYAWTGMYRGLIASTLFNLLLEKQ